MIHKKEYVRELIRRNLEGTLTTGEAALLKAAWRIYGREEWLQLLFAALDEVNQKESSEKEPAGQREISQPVLAKILEAVRRKRRRKTRVDRVIRYGMIAAAMLIVYIGFSVYNGLKQADQPTGLCTDIPDDMEIPVSEFATIIQYGDSTSIPVAAGMQGRIAQVGNLEITRDRLGTLVLTALRPASAADTVGHPAIRFMTAAFQQSEVRLPDGSLVRLNAGSVLTYPLFIPDRAVSHVGVSGEVIVKVPKKPTDERLVVETVNSQMQTESGQFAVLATAYDTRVTLVEGDLSVTSKQQMEQQMLTRSGSQAIIKWTHELNGSTTESLFYQRKSKIEEATGWKKASRRFRNVSLRDYVTDVSRWYGIKVKDIHCIPASIRVSTMICYRAPLDEALAVAQKAGLRVHMANGMYSFCDSDDAFKPTMARVDGQRSACRACDPGH